MQYDNIFNDFFYSTTATTLSYRIEDENGEPVFIGRAVGNSGGTRVNVAQKIRDWLFNEIGDFRESDGEFFDHPDAIHAFSLVDLSDNAVKEQWMVIYSFQPWNGDTLFLTTAINTHASPLQKLFLTNGAKIDVSPQKTQEITDGGEGDGPGGSDVEPPEPWIFTAYPTVLDYSCGEYLLAISTNKDVSGITVDTPSGISYVSKTQTGYTFTVEANTSSSQREFVLVFRMGDETRTVTLTQEGFAGTQSSLFAYKSAGNAQVDPNSGAVNPWLDENDAVITVTSDTLETSGDWSPYREKIFSNELESIGEYAFSGNTGITDLRWEASYGKTIHIDDYAFKDNQLLKSVVLIGDCGYESIDRYAFSGCTGLVSFESYGMPHSQKYWYRSKGVFSGCTSLTTVRLSEEFTFFEFPFVGCDNLREITVQCGPWHTVTHEDFFVNLPALTTIRLNGLKVLYYSGQQHIIRNCPRLTDLWWDGLSASASVAFRQIVTGCPSFTVHSVDGDTVIPSTL